MFFFFAGLTNYIHTYFTQYRFTNMSVFLLTSAVIIFMLGLVSEQIALLRMEQRASWRSERTEGGREQEL